MEPFVYRAQCIRVIDGDTAELYVDCGFYHYNKNRFRLIRINAPEMNSKLESERLKALEAKQYLIDTLKPAPFNPETWPLMLRTHKADSFGRWLCELEVNGLNVSNELLSKGLAVPYTK